MGKPDLYNILESFLQQAQDREFLHCLARVFHLFSGDAAMSSVAPFPSHPTILLACQILWVIGFYIFNLVGLKLNV